MKKFYIYLFFILVLSSFVTSALTDGIRNCYPFEEVINTGDVEDVINQENGTFAGTPLVNQDCQVGNCTYFDGSNDVLLLQDGTFTNTSNGDFTISYWYNIAVGVDSCTVAINDGNSDHYIVQQVRDSDNRNRFAMDNDGGAATIVDSTWSTGEWHFIVWQVNSSGVSSVFYDGSWEGSDSTQGNYNAQYLVAGCSYYDGSCGGSFYKGYVDELAVWNRTLDENEITELYNSGSGTSCNDLIIDESGTEPSLTLDTSLTEGNYTNDFTFYFNGTLNNITSDLWTCNLYLNGTLNETKTNLELNLTNQNFTTVFGHEQSGYNLNVTCNRTEQGLNIFDDFLVLDVFIDSVFPNLTISTTFINNSNYTTPFGNINYSVTAIDNNLFAVNHTIFRNGTAILNNFTTDINITQYVFNISEYMSYLHVGNYTINVTAWDSHTNNKVTPLNWLYDEDNIIIDDEIKIYGDIKPELTEFILSPDIEKYKFKLTFNEDSFHHNFYIETSEELFYLPDSNYLGHFVYLNKNRWIDLINENIKEINIVKLNINLYRIEIDLFNSSDELEFESIGSLNTMSLEWYFEVLENIAPICEFETNLETTIYENEDSLIIANISDNAYQDLNITINWLINGSIIYTDNSYNNINYSSIFSNGFYETSDLIIASLTCFDGNATSYLNSTVSTVLEVIDSDVLIVDAIDDLNENLTNTTNQLQEGVNMIAWILLFIVTWSLYFWTEKRNINNFCFVSFSVLLVVFATSIQNVYMVWFNFMGVALTLNKYKKLKE